MITIPGKIPIRIHPFFWMLIFAIGWLNSMTLQGTLIWAGVIFISVLVHEFGHALTALAFGQKANIDLIGMGGLTTRSGKTLKLWQEFLVVLNGPLAGICLYFLAFYLKRFTTVPVGITPFVLNVMIVVNLFWTLLNLLPIQPLDGGRLLSIIMEKLFGLKGVKITLFLSMCLAGILGLLFFYFNNMFGGSIFLIFMFESYRNWRSSLALTENDRNSELQEQLKEAERDINFGHTQTGVEKLQQLRSSVKTGILHLSATQHLAKVLMQQGKFQAAYELLKPLAKKLEVDGLSLLQTISYRLGRCQEALDVGVGLYRLQPTGEAAFINALCNAKLGDKRAALGWLQTTLREGLPNFQKLLNKEEFDQIRNDPAFKELLKS
jgi:stage IV sporulation protein FB